MSFSKDVVAEIISVASRQGVEPAALLAITEVESGGKAYTIIDGEQMPLILFEYHVFYRNLPRELRKEAVAKNLARRRWGDLPYKGTQKARYAQLARASEIHVQAAHAACSWGVGQVLGENAKWLGYKSPTQLAEHAKTGVHGQVELMLKFVERAGLMDELHRRDWRGFARRYNGPGQVSHYARLMENAYRRHGGGSRPEGDPLLLKVGSEGPDVAQLQKALRGLGYHLVVDGDFGPATQAAVLRFQHDWELTPDGIVGPNTLARIEALQGTREVA